MTMLVTNVLDTLINPFIVKYYHSYVIFSFVVLICFCCWYCLKAYFWFYYLSSICKEPRWDTCIFVRLPLSVLLLSVVVVGKNKQLLVCL